MPVRKPVEELNDKRYATNRDTILKNKASKRVKDGAIPRRSTIQMLQLNPTDLWQNYGINQPENTDLSYAKRRFKDLGAEIEVQS